MNTKARRIALNVGSGFVPGMNRCSDCGAIIDEAFGREGE